MELADVTDSKSVDGDIVRVRVPPPAPDIDLIYHKNKSGLFVCSVSDIADIFKNPI